MFFLDPEVDSLRELYPHIFKGKTKVLVNEGDKVKKGDTLVTMEAMKMENSITAEADGIVRKVHVGVGASVNQGDALVDFEGLAVPQTAPAQAPAQKPAAAPAAAAAPALGAGCRRACILPLRHSSVHPIQSRQRSHAAAL